MELLSSSLAQSEAYCAEPEIVEVLLRNKLNRARAPRTKGTQLQSNRECGRSAQRGAAQFSKITLQRSLCERCRTPSRLWLHHTCGVAKPPGGIVDKSACSIVVKSKARNGTHPSSKTLLPKRVIAFCPSAAVSSSPSGTPVSPNGQKRRSRGGPQRWGNEPGHGCSRKTCESPGESVGNGDFTRSSSSLQQGRSPHQNGVPRPQSLKQSNDSAQFASTIVTAKQFARRHCSAVGRLGEVKMRPENGDCFARSDGGGERLPAVRHATPFRHRSCAAVETVRDPREKLTCRCESHSRRGVELGNPANAPILMRHNHVNRRNISNPPTRGATAFERNWRIFEKAGAATSREAGILKRKESNCSVRETEHKVIVTKAPVDAAHFVGVRATARVDQGEPTLSKGTLRGAPRLRRDPLNEDRQTQCSEESFVSHKYSGVVTASDSDSQEDIPGSERSPSSNVTRSSTSRKDPCFKNTGFPGRGGRVNAGVKSAAAADFSDRAEKGHAPTSCGKADAALFESVWRGANPHSVEALCGTFVALRGGAPRLEEAALFSASELDVNLCNKRSLVRRAEPQEPLWVRPYKDDDTERKHLVLCNFKGEETPSDRICERIGQFLDGVECFLQESDPQLRRKKLYGIHTAFVSVAG